MQLAPAFHQIAILKNSIFDTRMGISAAASPYVLSSHHQAIDRLGQNLAVAARSLDGRIIEAVEHRRFDRVLGIQFHPEPYSLYRKGLRQRQKPGGPLDFNPRSFLAEHANSLVFHRDLWKWFCSCL